MIRRLWNVLRGRRLDDDLRLELDTHLALIEEEEQRGGASGDDARRLARRRFGSALGYREQAVEGVTAMWLQHLVKDLQFAARRLLRAPAFSLASALTLALAIGGNAAIFAVVYKVILNPLPYGNPDRLVALDNAMPSRNIPAGFNSLPSQLYYSYLDGIRTLEGLAIHRTDDQTLTEIGDPQRVLIVRTSPSLASVLQVSPALGRWFTDAEGVPGAAPVAVLSHGLWVRAYGQDRGVLGRTVTLDGVRTTIVGVMGPSFTYPTADVTAWIPLQLSRATATWGYSFRGVGRMREGSTVAAVRAEIDRLSAEAERAQPHNGAGELVSTATTLLESTVGRVSTTLWILLASVGIVLLVACANVANLFLVRSEARQREVAVRQALGAGTPALARYFLSESVLLSLAGGTIGLALAWAAVRVLVAVGPASLPRLEEVRLDSVTLAGTLALSLLTALVFGSIPLVRVKRFTASVREMGRGQTASRGRHRARQLFMGAQVAMALVLLVSSGLMLRSFQRLRAVDPGFEATSPTSSAGALTFRIGLPRSDYPDQRRIVAAHLTIVERLSRLPGASAAAAATCLPLGLVCNQGSAVFVEGRVPPPGSAPPIVLRRAVTGGYFETVRMRVLRGRGIARADVERNEPIVIVNELFAQAVFPHEDPIGHRIRLNTPSTNPEAPGWLTITGIVSNTPVIALGEPRPLSQVFMPLFATRDVAATRIETMSYVIRTSVPPLMLSAAAQRAVSDVDGKLALAQLSTLQDILDNSAAQMAFTMTLIAIAAGVGLLLGVIGIYGVMSYIVSQRTSEIGVRLALGARPAAVARMIVRQGASVALVGVTIGLTIALATSRLMSSLLYGVSAHDPGVFAVTTAILIAVALGACWLPARRAARLSPLEALRVE